MYQQQNVHFEELSEVHIRVCAGMKFGIYHQDYSSQCLCHTWGGSIQGRCRRKDCENEKLKREACASFCGWSQGGGVKFHNDLSWIVD